LTRRSIGCNRFVWKSDADLVNGRCVSSSSTIAELSSAVKSVDTISNTLLHLAN